MARIMGNTCKSDILSNLTCMCLRLVEAGIILLEHEHSMSSYMHITGSSNLPG